MLQVCQDRLAEKAFLARAGVPVAPWRAVHDEAGLAAAVGEIGLDRWIKDYDMEQQEEVFIWQLRLAAERNLPVSIHCLQAWGRLLEILRAEPRPRPHVRQCT